MVTILPNPANDFVNIKFVAKTESNATMRFVDNLGKTVLQLNKQFVKGNNIVSLTNLAKLNAGVYVLQFMLDDVWINEKIIITSK